MVSEVSSPPNQEGSVRCCSGRLILHLFLAVTCTIADVCVLFYVFCGSHGNVYFATHTCTYKRWKIPGSYENIRTSVDLTTAVTATAAASSDTLGLCPVDPEAPLLRDSNDKQALIESARSLLDIPRHN